MLVLSRKVGQKIRIGNNIYITVHKIQGEQVSLAFEAPSELKILREELIDDDHELINVAAQQNRKSVINKETKPETDLEAVAELLNDDL